MHYCFCVKLYTARLTSYIVSKVVFFSQNHANTVTAGTTSYYRISTSIERLEQIEDKRGGSDEDV